MNVKGKHILQADVATIWPMLQDEEVLARISPGVSRIEKVEEDQYRAISDISIGPVRGSFQGELFLEDKVRDETMTLVLSQKSKIGNAEAKIVMTLMPQNSNQTEIAYNGTAKVSGRLATMGQRILGGVISTLSKQVFKELEKIIEERKSDQPISSSSQQETISTKSSEGQNLKQETINTKTSIEEVLNPITDKKHLRQATNETTEIRKSFFQLIMDKIKSIWK